MKGMKKMKDIFMRFPQGKPKALTFSYDDGPICDQKLISIFNSHGLKGTFNVNSARFISEEEAVRDSNNPTRLLTEREMLETYGNSGHEIAVHGSNHLFMEQLPSPSALYEAMADRVNLERLFGTIVRGMAYPYGTFSDSLVEALKSAGIVYSRGVHSSGTFDIPSDWLRLHPTCHHNDSCLNELADKFTSTSPTDELFNRKPWLFYVWGHSFEFVRNNNWEIIENFADKVSGKDDVWYATNIEIYDYIEAYNRLKFNIDTTIVTNPSAVDVWFETDRKLVCVKGGETKKI
jgi:hypothetical protein